MFILWLNRLGHPRSIMMRQIIENSYKHPLKNQKILLPSDYPRVACSQDKLVIKPFPSKVIVKSPFFTKNSIGYMWADSPSICAI
jgi:hypothetical protein